MPLARDFTKFTTASPSVASFSFQELLTGLGYTVFYLTSSIDDSADDPVSNYDLTTIQDDPGNASFTSFPTTHPRMSVISSERVFTSTVFNSTLSVKGNVFLNFTLTHSDSATGSGSTITVTLYKNSTSIGTATLVGSTTNSSRTYSARITISDSVVFSQGDELKVGIGTDARGWIHHDPNNNDTPSFSTGGAGLGTVPAVTASNNHTYAKLLIPFEVEF